MRKVISKNELDCGLVFITIILFVIVLWLDLRNRISILLFCSVLLPIEVLLITYLIISKTIFARGLPLDCRRTPFGFIEYHVGKMCDHNSFFFISSFIDVTFLAIQEKKDVLIDTWLVSKDNIIKYFGNSVEFIEPGLIQRCVNFYNKKKFAGNPLSESYRCVIHVNLITPDQINALKFKKAKIEKRFHTPV